MQTEAKLRPVRLAAVLLAGGAHLGLAGLYLAFGELQLAAINAVSIAINGASAYFILRTRWQRGGLLLSAFEVLLHLPLMTWMVGVQAGYLVLGYVVTASSFLLIAGRQWLLYVVIASISAGSSALTLVFVRELEPVVRLPPQLEHFLFWWNIATTFVVLLLVCAYFVFQTERAQAALELERRRSEQLLLNVLPEPIAARLKDNPAAIADGFDNVTVLFADIVGFTQLGRGLAPGKLVTLLNDLFSSFDELADRHGLEKIKTIGDAYMAVGGLPNARTDHAVVVADFALDLLAAIEHNRASNELQIRIGIHTGPVVAGVIGRRKFAYDLWGDTVNTASRMESHGAAGCVQVSDATRAALGEAYLLEERGTIELKGIGPMRTWWLRGRLASAGRARGD